MAVFLQQAQDHDLHEAADMQAVGGAIKADIGGDRSGAHGRGQRVGVGALEDEAARGGFVEETVGRHGGWPVVCAGGLSHGGAGQMPRTIGLMSGTSLDGVDAAWLDTDGVSVSAFGPTRDGALMMTHCGRDLRAILDLAPVLAPYDPRLSGLVERLTDYHVRAVEKLGCSAELVGFHGQTILHQPDRRRTWQIGDAAGLAAASGCSGGLRFQVGGCGGGRAGGSAGPGLPRGAGGGVA